MIIDNRKKMPVRVLKYFERAGILRSLMFKFIIETLIQKPSLLDANMINEYSNKNVNAENEMQFCYVLLYKRG